MTIDFTKPVQTRDGRKVRILCTDAKSAAGSVVAIIKDDDGYDLVDHWYRNGNYRSDASNDARDLINVPPPKRKTQVHVHLRRDSEGEIYGVAVAGRPPHPTDNKVLASTIIEMEYEDQP